MYKKKDGYYRDSSCKYKLIAHIEIKDSSFIYTPEGMYFSELTINNSGIYKIINVRGNIKVDKNIFSIVVMGKSSGIGDVIIIYNNGLIELIDVTVYKK